MPLPRRARAVAVVATLVVAGAVTAVHAATADASATGCVQPGPTLRYLVVFPTGTPTGAAEAQVAADCGSTTAYYPQIAVGVATSPDPSFGDRMGPQRAYSAQAQAQGDGDADGDDQHKPDEMDDGGAAAVGNADLTGKQWDMAMIGADRAHRISEGSRKVLVGVLDSGIDAEHPDLVKAIDRSASASCLTGKPDTDPQSWQPTSSAHGTHVAGTIAAADDGKGTTGVAPGVRVASVKVVDDEGYIYPEYAVCGFMWAAHEHMTVTNNSYYVDPWRFTCRDSPGQSVVYEAMRRAVGYASANGVLNIAASTNSGTDLTDPGDDTASPDNSQPQDRQLGADCGVLPAALHGVVTVSSVRQDGLKAGYSSYGLGVIDLAAPGGERTDDGSASRDCVLSTVPGGYGYYCGTSMAAPHVTGVAALLASTHPGASPRELTTMLNDQARPVGCPDDYDLNDTGVQDAYCTGYSSYNAFYGHGLVDALAAVTPGTPVGRTAGQ